MSGKNNVSAWANPRAAGGSPCSYSSLMVFLRNDAFRSRRRRDDRRAARMTGMREAKANIDNE
jgi:hypothetical protein